MARLLKCYGTCNQTYPTDQLVKYKNKNHCIPCRDKKEKETAERERLYTYICKLYGLTFPTGMMLRQIKQFREERGYTYSGIGFTLDFIFRVEKSYKPEQKFGISMVPYFYEQAKEYQEKLREREKEEVLKPKVRKIKLDVSPPKRTNTYREKKLINMEDLLK